MKGTITNHFFLALEARQNNSLANLLGLELDQAEAILARISQIAIAAQHFEITVT